MLDAILDRAEVSVGHGNPIPKVKLDVCPLEITLQGDSSWPAPIHMVLHDFYLVLPSVDSVSPYFLGTETPQQNHQIPIYYPPGIMSRYLLSLYV
jgi:hypothetical protein